MKLNDFIKQDPTPRKSGYKVVVGDSPKEQELAKEASKVVALENSVNELQEKYNKVVEENEFFKDQVKRTQHEIDAAKDKVFNQENLQLELVQKENQFTLIQEELHELTIKEQKNSETIKQSIRLGEELRKAQENIRILKDKVENLTSKDTARDKETIVSNNLHTKLRADLKKTKLNNSKTKGFDELYTKVENFLDNKNQIKIDRETKERLQAMEWNVAKQELKLGNASTYPNKLGFGASTFFKLNNEEDINYG